MCELVTRPCVRQKVVPEALFLLSGLQYIQGDTQLL